MQLFTLVSPTYSSTSGSLTVGSPRTFTSTYTSVSATIYASIDTSCRFPGVFGTLDDGACELRVSYYSPTATNVITWTQSDLDPIALLALLKHCQDRTDEILKKGEQSGLSSVPTSDAHSFSSHGKTCAVYLAAYH